MGPKELEYWHFPGEHAIGTMPSQNSCPHAIQCDGAKHLWTTYGFNFSRPLPSDDPVR